MPVTARDSGIGAVGHVTFGIEGSAAAAGALEEKAKRMLKRCRYEDAAKVYQEVLHVLQLQLGAASDRLTPHDDDRVMSEIGALEGLAICLSRQLDDHGAEAAQRKALALRCRSWENSSDNNKRSLAAVTGRDDVVDGRRQMGSALSAKLAAVPCLRNLASFVSNQGRFADAEVVLRTVISIIELYSSQSHTEKAEPASGSATTMAATTPASSRPSYQAESEDKLESLGNEGGHGREGCREDSGIGDSGCDWEEHPSQMAAVARHHLAVVLHAQGRVCEAEALLEQSLESLKHQKPSQPVAVAQALHDLAGIVRPADPVRSFKLYREALQLLENARCPDHFLTAPTLAKLGSLLGDCLVGAAAIPPAPAAPAGPGATGIARAAGLAEVVCAPGGTDRLQEGRECAALAAEVAAAAGKNWDLNMAEGMIKRAVWIQGRYLGLRHPAVASSMRAMAELYRKQGRLAEAEPLFRRAIGIWESSPGPMDSDAVAALHGMAHCVLAGAGADWLGRFEEAFSLVDQAYRIASSQPGSHPSSHATGDDYLHRAVGTLGSDLDGSNSSSRLLLEALRMIRSRQRQGRGEPQPASTEIMDGVWSGRWDPGKGGGTPGESGGSWTSTTESSDCGRGHHRRKSSRGDDPRCAVCLEEVGAANIRSQGSPLRGLGGDSAWADVTADIGSKEALQAETEDARARGRFAYLPCGHRFHTHCIGRWLVHSCSCPSCRCQVTADATPTSSAANAPPGVAEAQPVSGASASPPGALRPGGDRESRGIADDVDDSVSPQAQADAPPGDHEGRLSRQGTRGDGTAPFC